jgi:selenocysteine lyase/cysteine desulfurase
MIDLERARADTSGSLARIHLDNARASLMPATVLAAMQDHLQLEAEFGSAEAADLRAREIEQVYESAGSLLNADPDEVTIYTGGTLDALAQIDLFVADVTSLLGRAPVDVQALERHAILANGSAYLRGPAGTGFLVLRGGRRARRDVNAAAVLGLGRAVEYALALGLDSVEARVDLLAETLRAQLAELPHVRTDVSAGVVRVEVEHRDPRDVAWSLRKRGITVGLDGGAVLASPHYFNTEHELEQVATAIRDL